MRLAFLRGLLAAVLVGGCARPAAPTQPTAPPAPAGAFRELPPSEPFSRAFVRLRGPDGRGVGMPVYVAADDATRRRGLMGRDSLPDGAGMAFLFPDDSRGGFWMKDTRIPLSIAFFAADGTVLRVLDMEPCAADPCPVYDPRVAYRGALEAKQGFFDAVGLEESWVVELPPGLPRPS